MNKAKKDSFERLRNIGPKSQKLLASVGISTKDDLIREGVFGTCAKLLHSGHEISLNMAYALEGAIRDCDWRELSLEIKQNLKAEFGKIKRQKS